MLIISHLTSGYRDSVVLEDVSLSFREHELTVLMGPNGAGKSTFLKSIFGLTTILDGTIEFEGVEIQSLPTHERLARGIAFVTQGKINFGTLTVEENLLLGAGKIKRSRACERLRRVYEEYPELAHKRHLNAFALSGGEGQLLGIARALMSEPKLLLLDEPSLGLSPLLGGQVFAAIRRIVSERKISAVMVEHNIKSAFVVADRGVIMVAGRIVAVASVTELKNSKILQQVFVGKFE